VPAYEERVPALRDGPVSTRPLTKLQPAQVETLLAEVT